MTKIKPIRFSVSSNQRMQKLTGMIVLASMALGLSGCQKPDSELAEINSGKISTEAGQSDKPLEPPSTTEPPEVTPEAAHAENVKNKIKALGTPDTEALKIDVNAETWKDAEPAPVPVASTLGNKIDDGLSSLPPTFALVGLEIVDRGAVLKSIPKVKIQDQKNFSIEYTSPESRGSTNSLTANGTERVVFQDGKVSKLAPFEERETRVKLSRTEIEKFAKDMPAEGFRYFSHGDRPWSAFIAGLQDSKNNFDVKITEMDANPVGEKRKFYRLIAKSTKGTPLELELVVDSKRNVPVVFRSHSKYADGQSRQMLWTASWSFGGNFEKDEFKIPMQKK